VKPPRVREEVGEQQFTEPVGGRAEPLADGTAERPGSSTRRPGRLTSKSFVNLFWLLAFDGGLAGLIHPARQRLHEGPMSVTCCRARP
jgi:hypothetical protein